MSARDKEREGKRGREIIFQTGQGEPWPLLRPRPVGRPGGRRLLQPVMERGYSQALGNGQRGVLPSNSPGNRKKETRLWASIPGITYGKIMAVLISYGVMTIPTREEHLIKTLRWLESQISPCPVCIRQINLIREELLALRRSPAIEGPPEAIGRPPVR